MHFKLIIAMAPEEKTDEILEVARNIGATGATIVGNTRGEGLSEKKGFWGLALEAQRELLLLVVEEHLCRSTIEAIDAECNKDKTGTVVALQIDLEDVIGIEAQISKLEKIVEEEI